MGRQAEMEGKELVVTVYRDHEKGHEQEGTHWNIRTPGTLLLFLTLEDKSHC